MSSSVAGWLVVVAHLFSIIFDVPRNEAFGTGYAESVTSVVDAGE